MNAPVLDITYLRDITEGNHEMEQEFFALFHKTASRCSETLSSHLDDDPTWDEAAHELKGAASYLGARRIQELCQQARSAEGKERAALVEQLKQEMQALEAFIVRMGYNPKCLEGE